MIFNTLLFKVVVKLFQITTLLYINSEKDSPPGWKPEKVLV
jgi:hypothetical protein